MLQGADCSRQRRASTGRFRSQWAAPGLNRELQIAECSAGPQPGAPDCSGQRRASCRGLPSGVGSAGPHPGSSPMEWAVPDLTSQKIYQKIYQKEISEICQTRMSEDISEDMSIKMSNNISKKNIGKNIKR